jgi:osmotically-inducible protein OsmY
MQARWQQLRDWGVVGLVALMLVGCATPPSPESSGELIDDTAITAKVQSSFAADPQVSASAISVATTHGVVHLSGTVANEQARHRAIQLTQGVTGVREIIVRNLIVQR